MAWATRLEITSSFCGLQSLLPLAALSPWKKSTAVRSVLLLLIKALALELAHCPEAVLPSF
jgi:hypothetical protein